MGRDERYVAGTVRGIERRQLVLDMALAAAVFAFSLGAMSHGNFDRSGPDFDALAGVLAALASLPLAARRLAPLPVFAVVTLATAAIYGFGYGLGPPIGFAVAVYTVAERRDETSPRTWTYALVASLAVLLGPHLLQGEFGPELVLGTVVWAAAWFAGDRTRLRRERLAELEERACERSARPSASAAWPPPRSAPGSHATCTTRRGTRSTSSSSRPARRGCCRAGPGALARAIETIEDVARETLGEIDQLVRALRDDGPPRRRALAGVGRAGHACGSATARRAST